MDWITEHIALGDRDDAMYPVGVDSVLNVAAEVEVEHQLPHRHIRIRATGPIPRNQIELAVDYLRAQRQFGRTILVHCQSGISRSPSILAAYLALDMNISPDAALVRIREKREYVDPEQPAWASAVNFVNSRRTTETAPEADPESGAPHSPGEVVSEQRIALVRRMRH